MSSDLDWLKRKTHFTVYEAAYVILGIAQPDQSTDYIAILYRLLNF